MSEVDHNSKQSLDRGPFLTLARVTMFLLPLVPQILWFEQILESTSLANGLHPEGDAGYCESASCMLEPWGSPLSLSTNKYQDSSQSALPSSFQMLPQSGNI